MQIPLDITYRDVDKSPALDNLIRTKVNKLEDVCDHIMGCHIAVEKAHVHPSHGSPFRVRLDLTVPPSHQIAVTKNPGEGVQYDSVESVIRDAFDAARRQLKALSEKQQNRTKYHPEQAIAGIITKLFPSEQYGFIKTLEGQEIYFHHNSLIRNASKDLTVGAGVQFFLSEGVNGPQVSTLRLIDQPGSDRPSHENEENAPVDVPDGWSYRQEG